jgi:membrane fusion protein, multidrug efflux system
MTDRISNISDLDLGQNHKLDPAKVAANGNGGQEPIQLDFNSALTVIDPPVAEAEAMQLPTEEPGERSWGKTAVLFGAVLGIGALGFLGIRNFSNSSVPKEKLDRKLKVTPVLVATAIQKTVPVQINAIGTVQSGLSVSVTPQVSGRINGVFFKKGQEIKKGQLLFTIDQQSQTAVIQQAQGVIFKDAALVQQAQATMDKDTGLIATAQATLAKDLQAIEQAKSTLDKDTGLITLAQANLAKDQGLIRQAKAVLAKDIAQSKYAQGQSQRYGNLYKQGAVSQDQAQQYSANGQVAVANIQADTEAIRNAEAVVQGDLAAIKNAQAVVRGDQAAILNAQAVVQGDRVAIENARAVVRGDQAAIRNAQAGLSSDRGTLKNAQVQLAYTKIYAPINGRVGNILVQIGNVVQPSANTPLASIVQINPIQVSFAVPASNLPEIQKQTKGGKLPVSIKLAATDSQPISGLLSFVNNTVDNTTGTIQLIGDFNNTDGKLYPGQYVNATLTLSETPNAIVVPSQAVQNGPNGQFVFVVKPDLTVTNTPVVATSAADGLNAIKTGLKAGDKVVTDGQANLVDGAQVRVKEPGAGKPDTGAKSGDSIAPTTDPKSGDIINPNPNPDKPSSDPTQTDRPHKRSGKHRSTTTDAPSNSPSPDAQKP